MKLMFIGEQVIDELNGAYLRLQDRRTLMRAVTRSAALVQRQAKINTTTVFANRAGRAGPTEQLSKSIWVRSNESQLSADIGPHVIYGRIQELGGTIRPVHAKMLAIPIGTMKGYARTHEGLHIQRMNGHVFLVDERGVLQYILKDFVIIEPRPYLSPALAAQQDNIAAEFDHALRQVFGRMQ
jgi:hypothetical protein